MCGKSERVKQESGFPQHKNNIPEYVCFDL